PASLDASAGGSAAAPAWHSPALGGGLPARQLAAQTVRAAWPRLPAATRPRRDLPGGTRPGLVRQRRRAPPLRARRRPVRPRGRRAPLRGFQRRHGGMGRVLWSGRWRTTRRRAIVREARDAGRLGAWLSTSELPLALSPLSRA